MSYMVDVQYKGWQKKDQKQNLHIWQWPNFKLHVSYCVGSRAWLRWFDDDDDDDDDDDVACVSLQADASPQENGACVDHGQWAAETHTVYLQWLTGTGDL